MDAAGVHAFALPIKALAYGGFGEDVAGRECGDLLPIGQSHCMDRLGAVRDVDRVT